MKKVMFTSLDGGQLRRDLVLSQRDETHFEACNLTVRIIADWSQGAPRSPSVVPVPVRHKGVMLKYKLDFPYSLDAKTGRISWGYHTSNGMLHHKTMLISRGGSPRRLLIGSFNWGNRGAQAYENTMVLPASEGAADTLNAFQQEFDAIWADDRVAATPDDAAALAIVARKKVQAGGSMLNLADLEEVLSGRISPASDQIAKHLADGAIVPALSGRMLTAQSAHCGFAASNNARKLDLLRPSGARKPARYSVIAVALEAIRSVPDGGTIEVAMSAMSPRVPEFGALLDAACRGCAIKVLLDQRIGGEMAKGLAAKAAAEDLPIEVRIANRRMHQKYITAPQSGVVVTGAANMTEDSSNRHAEHRVLFRDDSGLAARFSQDFNTIWARIGG